MNTDIQMDIIYTYSLIEMSKNCMCYVTHSLHEGYNQSLHKIAKRLGNWLIIIHENFGDDIIRGTLFMNTNVLFLLKMTTYFWSYTDSTVTVTLQSFTVDEVM